MAQRRGSFTVPTPGKVAKGDSSTGGYITLGGAGHYNSGRGWWGFAALASTGGAT